MWNRRQQTAMRGGNSGGTEGTGCCTLPSELQTGFRDDVDRPDVKAQCLCSPMGEAVGGEDGYGGASNGDVGAAVTGAGSRADVNRPVSGSRVEVRSYTDTMARHERAKALMKAIAEKGR